MEYITYEETFTGHHLRYAFQNAKTVLYMQPFIKRADGFQYDILASQEHIDRRRPYFPESTEDSYVEYKSLIGLTSLALLPYNSCMMHAAAVMLDGYCWLISAPPGTGKTTQYMNLRKLYGNQVEMICGDMPLLERDEEGNITVHPSPWNGKERIKGKRSALLGGILCLRQGEKNTIRRMLSKEAVFPVLTQMAIAPQSEEQIKQLAEFTHYILTHYPVWEMVNTGDLESSILAAETFRSYLKDRSMKYKARKGIVLTTICDQYVLVAAKKAQDTYSCPYVTQINDTAASCWRLLENAISIDEITTHLMEEYEIDHSSLVKNDVVRLIQEFEKNGYIIQIAEDQNEE